MENNIDEDMEKLDGFFNKGWNCDLDEIHSIVANIAKELETYKKANDNLLVKNAELKQDVQEFQQALNDENLRCSFYAIENNDLKEKLEIQGNITETYKKIAEKLADKLEQYGFPLIPIRTSENELGLKEPTKQELLDWARKEVEKDV
jgi:SMC interacting uncharacterized protein involved in chromosome segregation